VENKLNLPMENPKLPHGLDRVLPFRRFGQKVKKKL
jgi:hypothetical protein